VEGLGMKYGTRGGDESHTSINGSRSPSLSQTRKVRTPMTNSEFRSPIRDLCSGSKTKRVIYSFGMFGSCLKTI
jgi:hypothetical protein